MRKKQWSNLRKPSCKKPLGFESSVLQKDGYFVTKITRYYIRTTTGDVRSHTPETLAGWVHTHFPTILSRFEVKDIYEFFFSQLPAKIAEGGTRYSREILQCLFNGSSTS